MTHLNHMHTLLSPRDGFWEEDMPSYVLSIIDEVSTNKYTLSGNHLELYADSSAEGQQRVQYAWMALKNQGAISVG